MNTIVYNIWS